MKPEWMTVLARLTPEQRSRLLEVLDAGKFRYRKQYQQMSLAEPIDPSKWGALEPNPLIGRPVCEDGRCPLEIAAGSTGSSEMAILEALAGGTKNDEDYYHEICMFTKHWDDWEITPQELADAIRSLA